MPSASNGPAPTQRAAAVISSKFSEAARRIVGTGRVIVKAGLYRLAYDGSTRRAGLSYLRNPRLHTYVSPEIFGHHVGGIRATLKSKPALRRSFDQCQKTRTAIILVFGALGRQTRDNSRELLPEHSLRIGNGVQEILDLLPLLDLQKKTRAVLKAILHDLIEDGGMLREQLAELFGGRVADGVMRQSIPDENTPKGKAILLDVYRLAGGPKENPTSKDLKHAYRNHMLGYLKPDEGLSRAVDTLDKLISDAKDFREGNLRLGQGEFDTITKLEAKNDSRHAYFERCVAIIKSDAGQKYFGAEGSRIIAERLEQQFETARNDMRLAAVNGPLAKNVPDVNQALISSVPRRRFTKPVFAATAALAFLLRPNGPR